MSMVHALTTVSTCTDHGVSLRSDEQRRAAVVVGDVERLAESVRRVTHAVVAQRLYDVRRAALHRHVQRRLVVLQVPATGACTVYKHVVSMAAG